MRYLLLCLIPICAALGCTSFHYEEARPDGTVITADGGSLFKDSGIDSFAATPQSVELHGYSSRINQPALQAVTQAVVQGVVSALKLIP